VTRAARIASRLEAWYAREGRDLPWRRRRDDPYAVWVSEAMLQQTRVETVLGRYGAFLDRFPDLASLAAAPEDAVLKAWEGLGYYRRARLLHAGARAVVEHAGGRLPDTVEGLRALPGFGPYMAGAVASIAFGRRCAATDANAVRVLARLERLDGSRGDPALTRAVATAHAALVEASIDPGALNQAVMDLGARVCVRRPRCSLCPVRDLCAAFADGGEAAAARYPAPPARRAPRDVAVAMAVVADGKGRVLAGRRPPGLLGGLWGLPLGEGPDAGQAAGALVATLHEAGVPAADDLRSAGAFDWAFTHRRWHVEVLTLAAAEAVPTGSWTWLDATARADAAFGGPFRRALATKPPGESPGG